MLEAPSALVSYLSQLTPSVIVADLLTIVPQGGSALRYTNGETMLDLPSSDFPANSPLNGSAGPFLFLRGPRFDRVKIPPRKIGLDAQEAQIRLYPTQADLIGDYTWQEYAFAEEFDAATIEVDRFHWTAGSGSPLGSFITIYGDVTDVEIGRSSITLTAKTLPYLLDIPMPRRMYQGSCNHVFGGEMCGYDRVAGKNALGQATGAGAVTVTAIAGTSQTDIVLAGSGVAAYYGLGTAIGVTGANEGISRTIASTGIPTVVGLYRGFPFPIALGDTFQLLPGCDHTLGTCANTFNNAQTTGGRFGGFPYIPSPELSL